MAFILQLVLCVIEVYWSVIWQNYFCGIFFFDFAKEKRWYSCDYGCICVKCLSFCLSLTRLLSLSLWTAPFSSLSFSSVFFVAFPHPEYSINFYDCNRQNHFHRVSTHIHTLNSLVLFVSRLEPFLSRLYFFCSFALFCFFFTT